MASIIGALRVILSADTAQFQKGMRGAQSQAATSTRAIQKSLGGIRTAMTSLAAAATVGSLVAVSKRALEYASSLGEVSRQLGVTTRDLQVYRYAASQVGISQEEMDKGLARLTLSMSKAQAGSKPVIAAFKALDISVADLKNKSAGDVLLMMADGFAKVGGASKGAAAGAVLMSRNFQNFVPLFDAGSQGIREFAAAAERLGLVLSDEQIQRADETADKLSELKQVLEARIAGVVADNASSILSLANSFAQLAAGIARFWASNPERAMGLIGAGAGAFIGRVAGPWGAAAGAVIGYSAAAKAAADGTPQGLRNQAAYARRIAQQNARNMGYYNTDEASRKRILRQGGVRNYLDRARKLYEQADAMERAGSIALPAGGGGGGGGGALPNFLGGGGGGGRRRGGGSDDAERKRKQALRDAYDFATDQRRAQMNVLRAQQDLYVDLEDRNELEEQILSLEQEQERAANKLAVDLGGRTQAEADILQATYDKEHSLRLELNAQENLSRAAEEGSRLATRDLEIQRELLEGQAALAETAAERRKVELRILDLAYEQERKRHEAVLSDPRAGWADQEEARRGLASMGARYGQDRAAVLRGTAGPLEQFMRSIPDTAEKANEALQNVAADGLQSLVDGITDAIMGAKSLGQTFKEVAKQIIADLVRIAVQRAVLQLADVAFSALGGTPTASKTSGTIGAGLPKYASGGSMMIGGMAGIDRNLLSLNGQPIAKVSRGERLRITPANDRGSGGIVIKQTFAPNLAGSAVDRGEMTWWMAQARQQTLAAVREAKRRGG